MGCLDTIAEISGCMKTTAPKMILKLVLTYQWYDMIEAKIKKEEYREIKDSMIGSLFNWQMSGYTTRKEFLQDLIKESNKYKGRSFLFMYLKQFTHVQFYRGYHSDRKTMTIGIKNITIGKAKPEWSIGWKENVFIIKLDQ